MSVDRSLLGPTGKDCEAAIAPADEKAIDALAITRADGIGALEQYAADIDRVNLCSSWPNPFLSAAFLICYATHIDHHQPGGGERLFVIREGDRVIGYAPMRLQDGRYRLLAPLDTDRPGVLATPPDGLRVATALVRHLCRRESGWSLLEFFGQSPGSALHRATHAAAGGAFRTRDIELGPYNDIPLRFPDLRAYFQSLTPKMRSNVARQVRRLYAEGKTELLLAEGAAATSAWFAAYCDLNERSWKRGTPASIQRHPRRVQFYQELIAGNAGLDPAFIGVLFDDVLIAGLITASNRAASPAVHGSWCLEMAYDQAHAQLGPGQLLLLLAVGEALRRGDRRLSFMQNFAYYKHRWNAEPTGAVSTQLIRRASLTNLRATLGDLKRRLSGRSVAAEPARDREAMPPPIDPALARQRQSTASALTAAALDASDVGVRRLDREQARRYLPFQLA